MRDRMGNELEPGQTISVEIGGKAVQGKILKLVQGGLSITGAPNVITPDVVHLHVIVTCTQPPNQPQPSITRLVNPETEVVVPKMGLKEV